MATVLARESLLKRSIRSIILAFALTALAVAGGSLSASAVERAQDAKVFGSGDSELKPDCGPKPNDSCTAIGSTTVFTNLLGDKEDPFRAPADGRIVAWAVELGHKPSDKDGSDGDDISNLEFYQDLFGSDRYGKGPVARLAILKRQSGVQYKLVDQSPAVKLSGPFYNKDTVITLDQPLPIKEGEVVGLTSLTWVPTVRSKGRGGGKAGYRASIPRESGCDIQDEIDARPHKRLDSVREYGCKFDSRLFYKAYFVPN